MVGLFEIRRLELASRCLLNLTSNTTSFALKVGLKVGRRAYTIHPKVPVRYGLLKLAAYRPSGVISVVHFSWRVSGHSGGNFGVRVVVC